MPKIYIIGASGAGKSYFAKRLSQKLGIAHLNLDDVAWIPSPHQIKYNHQYDKDILPQILQNLEQHGKRIHRVCGKRRFLSFGKFGL